LLGTLDFGKKVTAIELWRISTQDNYVGIEGEDCLHPISIVGRDLKASIAKCRDDIVPETVVGLHYQRFSNSRVHDTRFFCLLALKDGWCRLAAGCNVAVLACFFLLELL
jgi:hypothetical protein